MKKLIFLTTITILSSCANGNKENETQPIRDTNKTQLEVLGVYQVEGGSLYIYKFNNDTIYWAEGRSSTSPVGLQVK